MLSPGFLRNQKGISLGLIALGAAMAVGAWIIPSDAGYAGVGPDFLPWLVSIALMVCGGLLLRQTLLGGFRVFIPPSGDERGNWAGFAWISAGLLLNAALLTTIGFILSCALCFVLAVQGLRGAQGGGRSLRGWVVDTLVGMAISAPVYWMFTKLLAINLPGLTNTGWI
ncbi:tripartite tricarboxylate transporter TctB family protein [Curvibacter sp. APW13]|uniref:tripartite tricarboxylate transporter TctB family protein n=1 Tax=Curvibacter sp. APW13 TaxID=3077236 RepID=UPI0028DF38AC|nr:tripartite tricarboxylate transporter TctB family protein [Curvibacter sp. APW13]MDT8991433.1 tripartite tricarboxylate transporter TctB family protein [Curvibacter sp. APW13]